MNKEREMNSRIYEVTVRIAVPFYGIEDGFSGSDYIEAAQEATILDMDDVRLQLVPFQGKK
jgi:hypothetical protein